MTEITFKQLLDQAKQSGPVLTAVVHPCSTEALEGAIEAAKNKLITPLLVGPAHKIKRIAQQAKIDFTPYEIIDVEHSEAAAAQAVELVRTHKAQMLMKGSLHTDEFMHAIIDKNLGLRTGRRMSHVFVAETANYKKLLFITDCALNITPQLMEKKDIVQNAIELANALNIHRPKVAILSAIETITDKIQSTIDAAALCKMAERGQIINAILDGPLAFDNAVSREAASIKHIVSEVAGNADILLAPDLEAGNMIAKQLQYLGNAKLAGIVMGARVPIILTSRADGIEDRIISCALGVIYLQHLEQSTQCCPL